MLEDPLTPMERQAAPVARLSVQDARWRRWFSGLAAPYKVARHNRALIVTLVRRDLESTFRGAILGKVWVVIAPLIMLALYTFVFGIVLNSRWQGHTDKPFLFPVLYFSGLILFNFFFDSLSRAPNLMRENRPFIRQIVFPVEVFGFVVIGSSCVRFVIGLGILTLFYLPLAGVPPVSALAYPAIFVGLALFALGFTWMIAGLAVFVRDLAHVMAPLSMLFLFLTPLFYPLSLVPEAARVALMLNPLAYPVEAIRNALFFGEWPGITGLAIYISAGWLWAALGHALFIRLRPGFADVV